MDALEHNSRMDWCRTPQGAVQCGASVRLSVFCPPRLQSNATLRVWQDGVGERLYPLERVAGELMSVTLDVPDTPCLLWYYFIFHAPDGKTLYYGGESGEGRLYPHEPPAWRITVYDGTFTTPKWFQNAIVYQIFPDRFRRSSWEDFRARAEAYRQSGRSLRIHDDWRDAPAYRAEAGEADYVPNDYFGGDLNGIREKLPYLASLGVTCLYLNPIFEAASNHRYNTGDYLAIDPLLGTEDDFVALCREAKRHGIRILLDGVFSHTGSDSRYFDRNGRYGGAGAYQSKDSPYARWYRFRAHPDDYECWWDFPTLPNVEELEPSYLDFIAGEDGVLAHWMRRGASGWRLDVADELPDEFIRALRKRVKRTDADGVLLGEAWEECSNKQGANGRRGYVNGDELDSAMGYPFRNAVVDYLCGRIDADALNDRLQSLREWYPAPFYMAMLNLLSSHDIVRAVTALSGAPDRDALTREEQAVYRPSDADAARGRERFLLATAVQMFHPGVPCVYYGDEAGMTGMADPFNRGAYPWGHEDAEVFSRVSHLMRLRSGSTVLQSGRCRMGALGRDGFGIVRFGGRDNGAHCAILAVNRGDAPLTFTISQALFPEGADGETPMPLDGHFADEYGENEARIENTAVTVPARSAWIRMK